MFMAEDGFVELVGCPEEGLQSRDDGHGEEEAMQHSTRRKFMKRTY